MADEWTMTAKALRPLPVAHKPLSEEARVRQRYVDLIVRPQAREMVRARATVVRSLRDSLHTRGFIEVETPMLQLLHGGAAARPFITHSNALDIDLYLRIAPELFLKRAVVGGIERVFESTATSVTKVWTPRIRQSSQCWRSIRLTPTTTAWRS